MQFVTVDQVDKAKSSEISLAQTLKQTESQLRLSQAGLQSALAQYERSKTGLDQSTAQHEQAQHAVTTLEPLVNQRGARAAAAMFSAMRPASTCSVSCMNPASRL